MRKLVFAAATIFATLPAYALADPVISSFVEFRNGQPDLLNMSMFFGVDQLVLHPPPLSDFAFSTRVTTPGFADPSVSGGGAVQFGAPQFSFDPSRGTIAFDNFGGSVTTVGPGTASVHFGEAAAFSITNVSANTDTLALVFSYGLRYSICDSGTSGHPNCFFQPPIPDEQMNVTWSFGVEGDGLKPQNPLFVSFSSGCPIGSIDVCGPLDFADVSQDILLTIDPGQTLDYTMSLDATWTVTEVPEPSSLVLLASMLGLGLYPLWRTGKAPE